jgi:Ca-activated chloride channel family protein
MGKRQEYTYRQRNILIGILIWEVVFWVIAYQLLNVFGVFSEDFAGEKVVFLKPKYAWFLLIVPVFIAVQWYIQFTRNRVVKNLGSQKLVTSLLKPISSVSAFVRFFLVRNIVVFAILALMQPAFGNKKVQATTNGVEMIFAVDLSNSMNTRDIEDDNSRLTVAKRAMNQFVNQAPAAKVGLLVFAGSVYPQLPLTADKSAAKMHIDELSTNFISNQGTNISAAIEESSVFFSSDKTAKVLILITDGENHEGGIDQAVSLLKEKEVKLLVLGIGSQKGGLVPASPGLNSKYLKDDLGRTVISKLNTDMIENIAAKAKGDFIISSSAFPNINPLLTQINSSETTNEVDLEFEVKENRYQWPLFLALLCIALLWGWESLPSRPKKRM